MSDVVIRAEGLGKRYRIGERGQGMFRYKSLRDSMAGLFHRRSGVVDKRSDTFWALKDGSFEVKRGEVVGIIGRNGAGKSTLLKILSRITEPTEGQAEIHGRVGSLLEVGTGFHPELTGRENIFLNGAILGMRRAEIAHKFDEIVAFAEVEKFIDTPVKHFSSGMYVRLAFAVAAHLQPEVLLVDEVLAVGDTEFQKKCIGKMEKISHEGRTVMVVSHSMSTVKALCSRAMLLNQGIIETVGTADTTISQYLNMTKTDDAEKLLGEADHLTGVRQIRATRIRLLDHVSKRFAVYWKQDFSIEVNIDVQQTVKAVAVGAGIRTIDGAPIVTVQHDDDGQHPLWDFEVGSYTIEFRLQNDLRPGLYSLHVGADQGHIMAKNIFALNAVTLEVLDHSANGQIPSSSNEGIVNGKSRWNAPLRRS